MNIATVTAALLSSDTATLVDINDWAVNVVREYCADRGYNAAAVVTEESRRMANEAPTLPEYLKVRRIGSHHLLTRRVRIAVFTAVVSRRLLTA